MGPRRRPTPTPYSVEETQQLRQALTTPGTRARCPACKGVFTLGPRRVRGLDFVRKVTCLSCGRNAVVANTTAMRVLVIDAKTVLREAVRSILMNAGHEVVEAADGGVGLQAYQEHPADVIFLNMLETGRMDVGEFVRQLRSQYADARVVAMTARSSYGTVDPLAIARQFGPIHTIRIPFSPDDLLKAVTDARE